jgi:polyisoprenoid-binding protein YceI
MKSRLGLAAILISALAVSVASASIWNLDPAHTNVGFDVQHMMLTTVHGSFAKFDGTVKYDPAKPGDLAIDATIDASSVDTRNDRRDEHLRSADFFDVTKFPNLTFKSKKTEVLSPGHFKVTGDLTIHGVTKEVALDVKGLDKQVKDPRGNARMAATATTRINREDYGLMWNKALESGGVLVSKDVQIVLDVELQEAHEDQSAK